MKKPDRFTEYTPTGTTNEAGALYTLLAGPALPEALNIFNGITEPLSINQY